MVQKLYKLYRRETIRDSAMIEYSVDDLANLYHDQPRKSCTRIKRILLKAAIKKTSAMLVFFVNRRGYSD
ncbi:hypothetical protein C0W40_10575 [Photobacterium leiognathi subsp. mandapamensis]|nr:hypothetical protein C0W40_10575 [Photobacterium leiognathi subsp. mandapamensis]